MKSNVTIAGRRLTVAELGVLDHVRDFMQKHGANRNVPVREVFPHRSNQETANRRALWRLSQAGVLGACEIVLDNGGLRLVRAEEALHYGAPAFCDRCGLPISDCAGHGGLR